MTQKAKNIVEAIPQLTLAELWFVIEAAQAQIRQQTIHPEAPGEQAFLASLNRRFEEIFSRKATLIPGDIFDAELEKMD